MNTLIILGFRNREKSPEQPGSYHGIPEFYTFKAQLDTSGICGLVRDCIPIQMIRQLHQNDIQILLQIFLDLEGVFFLSFPHFNSKTLRSFERITTLVQIK